tara:strand:+ start:436 stop:660 length:225 start_codon:yes stop_codon:yes gene_type:complete
MIIAIKDEKEESKIGFPKIMSKTNNENEMTIVLFESTGKGTVISCAFRDVGYYACNWNMNAFLDFEGEITIKNN